MRGIGHPVQKQTEGVCRGTAGLGGIDHQSLTWITDHAQRLASAWTGPLPRARRAVAAARLTWAARCWNGRRRRHASATRFSRPCTSHPGTSIASVRSASSTFSP